MSSSRQHPLLLCSGSLEGGGSERQIWQLAKGIDCNRFQPNLYLLYRRGVYLDKLPSSVKVHDFWSQVPSQPNYFPGQIHRQQVRHLVETICNNSIRLVYDRTFHMTLVTAAACRKAKVPRISVIVSPPSRDFASSRERFKFLKRRLLRRAYKDPEAVTIAVTPEVAKDASDFLNLPPENIQVVPSPVDSAAIEQLAGPSKEISVFTCCVVGRMTGEKGQLFALQAFAQLQRMAPELSCIKLEVVGDGPDRLALESKAAELGIAPSVHFRGYLENPYPIIANADLLILPSRYEGLPNVMLEAMALRTPVVAAPCSETVGRILGGYSHGMGPLGVQLQSRDPNELAAVIQRLSHAPGEVKTYAKNAYAYVRSEHGLESWLEYMQGLFEDKINSWGQA